MLHSTRVGNVALSAAKPSARGTMQAIRGLVRPRQSSSQVCRGQESDNFNLVDAAQSLAGNVTRGSDFALESRPKSLSDTDYMTTNTGMPVYDNRNSLTVGDRGPMLMEDMHYFEKLGNFHRERIPERVVHARGVAAKGHFEVTHDISHLTCADFLSRVGKKTSCITRFSMVTHPSGAPETLRDTRGFATKFYTMQGNYDLVGNNMPVFFVRDGISFPDIVHALKPNPKTNYQEDWRILDFMLHHPEGLHMMMWLLDDVGIPRDYRHMEGFGVHTFKLINKDGNATYVKFHWKPRQGVKNFIRDEDAWATGGHDHQHATRDLYHAIDDGDFPEWDLMIQTMDPAKADDYDFEPLDPTRTWPEDQFPLQPVGKLVLNENVHNYFSETEMLAFAPSNIVPGIELSDDKLLQSRVFSYGDAQRYRLSANYGQIPVNAPKCPFHNNHFDGTMNPIKRTEEVNYFPSTQHSKWQKEAEPYPRDHEMVSGPKVKKQLSQKVDDFQQPRERYHLFDADRRSRFEDRVVKMLMDPRAVHLRDPYIELWSKVDEQLGKNLQAKMKAKAQQLQAMHN